MKWLVLMIFVGLIQSSWAGVCPFSLGQGKKPSNHPHSSLNKGDSLQEPFDDVLTQVNAMMFKTFYPNARQALIDATSGYPLIVNLQGNLTLMMNGQYVDSFYYTPDAYTRRKQVSHTLFSTFLMLEPSLYLQPTNQQVSLNASVIQVAQDYLSRLYAVNDSLATCCNFDAESLGRQYSLVGGVIDFLSAVLSKSTLSQDELAAFANSYSSLIIENIKESAIAQLNLIHSKVMVWKSQIDADDWDRLHYIVVNGPHMPRTDELTMQYFARLLKSPINSGLRMIYAEALETLEDALVLLGTHLIDFSAGQAFFNDPEFMHRDILAKATHDYLPYLIPNDTLPVLSN